MKVSILILLDYQFYPGRGFTEDEEKEIVSILILLDYQFYQEYIKYAISKITSFNPYSTGLSILSTLCLSNSVTSAGFNPYSTGLSILS